jgi:nucleotide-binding universal stress UspA family protein
MYRNILLCYDGTEQGRNALNEGAELALAMNAHTHLQDEQAAMRILREGVEWLKARNLSARGQLVFGDPVSHIATCARTLGCDLIVVGHRHRSRLARWWSEDEDARLMEQAPCSVRVALGAAPSKRT